MTSITFRQNADGIIFDVVFDQGKTSIFFADPTTGDISDFEAVSKGLGIIRFCDAKGLVYIKAKNGLVSFEVSTSGSGGDGEIFMTLPFKICQKALIESFESRKLMDD